MTVALLMRVRHFQFSPTISDTFLAEHLKYIGVMHWDVQLLSHFHRFLKISHRERCRSIKRFLNLMRQHFNSVQMFKLTQNKSENVSLPFSAIDSLQKRDYGKSWSYLLSVILVYILHLSEYVCYISNWFSNHSYRTEGT